MNPGDATRTSTNAAYDTDIWYGPMHSPSPKPSHDARWRSHGQVYAAVYGNLYLAVDRQTTEKS